MKINDPVADISRIRRLVKKGFLVRTRADSDTNEARLNSTRRRDKAFASGAHFVSTDYPEPDRRFSAYPVRFDGNVVARVNPVTGNAEWRGHDLDNAAWLSAPEIDGDFSDWTDGNLVAGVTLFHLSWQAGARIGRFVGRKKSHVDPKFTLDWRPR